jgi:hypothetical protein
MKGIRSRDSSRLQGEKAIVVLRLFIKQLETEGREDLTEIQTKALKNLANGLIESILADTWNVSEKQDFLME